MSWHFCVDSTEKRALDLCGGSLTEGGGFGHIVARGYGGPNGDGNVDSFGYANRRGDGHGCGYATANGNGRSATKW